jgi:hypothetical protein
MSETGYRRFGKLVVKAVMIGLAFASLVTRTIFLAREAT